MKLLCRSGVLPGPRSPRPPSASAPRQPQPLRRPARIDEELRLLEALRHPGCPICAQLEQVDRQYFFWFFNENYAWPATTAALSRSLGFCLVHGDQLTQAAGGSSQIRYVHEMMIRDLRAHLGPRSRAGGGRVELPASITAPEVCPACRHRQEAASRSAFWLARLLEEPSPATAYGDPGLLCFPHLQMVASALGDEALVRILLIHRKTLEATLETVPVQRAGLARSPEDPVAVLRHPLSMCVGHEACAGADPYPALSEYAAPAALPDPVRMFLGWLREEACPVCRAVRHAWLEWISWLQHALSQGERVDDLLPTCPPHVWSFVRGGPPLLAFAAARAALTAVASEVATALPRPSPPPAGPLLARLTHQLRARRRHTRMARDVLSRGIRCPVCHRLSVAADRAIALLHTLLLDPRHRDAVDAGYGLCLKHFARAVATAPSEAARGGLIRVQEARLALLQWELEESGRKLAWQYRPETKGREDTAWLRALVRFSGSLRAPSP